MREERRETWFSQPYRRNCVPRYGAGNRYKRGRRLRCFPTRKPSQPVSAAAWFYRLLKEALSESRGRWESYFRITMHKRHKDRQNPPSNTARIAKNTLLLYFRQIVIMLVSLYTVRVVLEILGAEDFGIYSVVGGLVVLFTFLNSAMTSATQRFLNFALGRNDTEQARDVYSASIVIHAAIAVVVVVLAATVGLWFFYTWLNIPDERQEAAFAVYQFSVAATVIGILQVPYRATIIAYEKMSFFAMLGIVEAALRLGVIFLLPVILFDHLIVYAFLVFATGIVLLLIHKAYCNRSFETARFRFCRDKDLFKRLLGFSGWSVFGGVANLSNAQGTSILLNIFHGVTVNAAMGIANQVNSAVYQFVGNFQTAFNPQIVRLYSAKDHDGFIRLVFRTSKISYCLLLFLVLPLYVNTGFVLQLWLNDVPEYTIVFTQLIMASSLLSAIAAPLWMSIQATGEIKKYQLILSCFVFANLPLSLLFLLAGFNPAWVVIIRVGLDALVLVWRIFFLRERIKFPAMNFFGEVVLPLTIITCVSFFITAFTHNLFTSDWGRLIISCIISTIIIGCLTYFIGLTRQERISLGIWVKAKVGNDKNYPK